MVFHPSVKPATPGKSVVLLLAEGTIQKHQGTIVESTGLKVGTPPFLLSVCSYVGQFKESLPVSSFEQMVLSCKVLRKIRRCNPITSTQKNLHKYQWLLPSAGFRQKSANRIWLQQYLPQLTSPNHNPLFQETTSRCALQKDVHLF